MKPIRVALALLAIILLAGCSSTSRLAPTSGDEVRTVAQDGASAAESIAAADLLYREALAHYVTDANDEARPLLRQALAELGDAHPDNAELRSLKASLKSRVEYFLASIDGRGGDSTPAIMTETARIDTVPLAVLEPTERTSVCDAPVITVTNDRVQFWLDYFTGKGRKDMERWLSRFPGTAR